MTVHVYSPPLARFPPLRRAARVARDAPKTIIETTPTIAVVGGGFSGSMTAAQILRRAKRDRRVNVVLVERRGSVGEGLAYGTRDPAHLLNVPAGRMSAWPDRPDDFVRWATERYGQVAPQEFLPVPVVWRVHPRDAVGRGRRARARRPVCACCSTKCGGSLAVRPVAGWCIWEPARCSMPTPSRWRSATGPRPTRSPTSGAARERLIADPWRPFALNSVKEDEPVVVLGSGLTAVDAAMSLASRGRALLTLVSRHGLLPWPMRRSRYRRLTCKSSSPR